MKLRYRLTYEDNVAYQKDFIRMTRYHRRKEKIAFVLLLLFSFMLFFNVFFDIFITLLSIYLGDILAAIGAIVVTLLISPFLRKFYSKVAIWQYRRAFDKTKDQDWPKDLSVTLNDEGIEVVVDNSKVIGKTQFSWKAFKKASEDEERFYLYQTDTQALILPKREPSATSEEQKEMERLIMQHAGHLFRLNKKQL